MEVSGEAVEDLHRKNVCCVAAERCVQCVFRIIRFFEFLPRAFVVPPTNHCKSFCRVDVKEVFLKTAILNLLRTIVAISIRGYTCLKRERFIENTFTSSKWREFKIYLALSVPFPYRSSVHPGLFCRMRLTAVRNSATRVRRAKCWTYDSQGQRTSLYSARNRPAAVLTPFRTQQSILCMSWRKKQAKNIADELGNIEPSGN